MLKRFFFLLILCTVVCIPAIHAQHFYAGLSAGPVVSDVQGTDTRDYDNDFHKIGISAGAFVNRKIGRKTTLQLELNYVQKGTEQLPDSNNDGYFKLRFNYVEAPLLIRHGLQLTSGKSFVNNFEWELGVLGGYLLSYEYITNGYNLTIDPTTLNKIDISVLGGINYIFPSGFYFSVRYSNSLIPVIKHSAIPSQVLASYPFTANNGNNMVFQFCLKYVIGGGKDM